jgi:hypothetical protein
VAAHWFRIPYAHNAFLRSLDGSIDALTVPAGVDAMLAFGRDFRPQHAHLDVLECTWGPAGDAFEFAITRRMQRHENPEFHLSLVFGFALSPARQIDGTAPIEEARHTEGYRAIARAAILARRLD